MLAGAPGATEHSGASGLALVEAERISSSARAAPNLRAAAPSRRAPGGRGMLADGPHQAPTEA
jgi:hypothetical protein